MEFVKLRKCRACRQTFLSTKLKRGCCSEECIKKRKEILALEAYYKKEKPKLTKTFASRKLKQATCFMCKREFFKKRKKNIYCGSCKPKIAKKRDWLEARKKWNELGLKEKEILRSKILLKCNYKCMICYLNRSEALVLDHIIPLRIRPDLVFNEDNLQSLCFSCNRLKGVQENDLFAYRRRKFSESSLGK